jgi:hypothetical protein
MFLSLSISEDYSGSNRASLFASPFLVFQALLKASSFMSIQSFSFYEKKKVFAINSQQLSCAYYMAGLYCYFQVLSHLISTFP